MFTNRQLFCTLFLGNVIATTLAIIKGDGVKKNSSFNNKRAKVKVQYLGQKIYIKKREKNCEIATFIIYIYCLYGARSSDDVQTNDDFTFT